MTSTELAARLGICDSEFPSLFEPDVKYSGDGDEAGMYMRCTLPMPDSDDPQACLWEPFLMRVLGWPSVGKASHPPLRWTAWTITGSHHATSPTAALYAAWQQRTDRP